MKRHVGAIGPAVCHRFRVFSPENGEGSTYYFFLRIGGDGQGKRIVDGVFRHVFVEPGSPGKHRDSLAHAALTSQFLGAAHGEVSHGFFYHIFVADTFTGKAPAGADALLLRTFEG